MLQKAVGGPGNAEVALKLLVDVDKAWRRLDARLHAEAQAMRLSRSVIGVLPKDDDLHPVQRGQVQRENIRCPWGRCASPAPSPRRGRISEPACAGCGTGPSAATASLGAALPFRPCCPSYAQLGRTSWRERVLS